MATFGGCGSNRVDNLDGRNKSPLVTPQKVRELLNEGVVCEERRRLCVEPEAEPVKPNGLRDVPCEAVSKEAFFSRVESYSCLKWAGKPPLLSPLRCARYGWVNIDCDMLKCSSCQAFLCASVQACQDFKKYEGRILELTKLLQTQHEKFCFWPDFPCPDRFWMVPVNEPGVLLKAFLERFKSSCLLELQLPAMRPEHLKSMALTEDVMGILLQLVEEELRKEARPTAKLPAEPLAIQVAACIVALCGWAASPGLRSLHLPVLTCSYCQRKVGLWSFQQIEGMTGDGGDESFSAPSTPVQGLEGRADRATPSSPTPCRMKLRSQDTSRPEQPEASPSPVARTRSRDSPSPSEEPPSPLPRGKRPMTRSRGQGEGPAPDPASSPQRKAKRPRLSSSGSPEGPMHRNMFDPVAQHRDWCPWVSTGRAEMHREAPPVDPQAPPPPDTDDPQPGWKASLSLFLSMKKCLSPTSPSQGLHDKSKRVFKIFRQWQVSSSSQ